MIAGLKELFGQLFAEPGNALESGPHQAVQVATAVLLIEMMRVDFGVADVERAEVAEALRKEFALDPEQLNRLIALAETQANDASGYHQFTSVINTYFDLPQKIDIIEKLWRIAMVDLHLSEHELHLMRRLGDLLHVDHADFVSAKQRARQAVGLPPG